MAPLKTFFELSMKKDKNLPNLKMKVVTHDAPGASDIKKAVNSGFKTDANRKAAFAKMNDSVQSADRKPEKYMKPDGKIGIRMVKTDKEVIKKEASVLKPTKPSDITKHARTLAKNSGDYERNKKKYIDKARAKVFRMYPKESLNGLMKEESVDKATWPDEMPPIDENKYTYFDTKDDAHAHAKKHGGKVYTNTGKGATKVKGKPVNTHVVIKDDVDEALNLQQRMKRSRLMKRMKARIKIGRKRAMKKMANKKTIEKRAMRQARNQIAKKLTRGIPKGDLTFARKQEIEKRLAKPALQQRIKRIAKKLFKDVRKKELQRKKG